MAVSLVRNGREILSHVTASQILLHQKYGGVFPEMAARAHVELVIPTLKKALVEAAISPEDIDRIAVANGPGLMGSLLVGLNCAKSLALAWKKPLVGVNHVEAHLYAAMMAQEKPQFPALGVVISGGHTLLLRIEDIGRYACIGTTVDDAIGEAFDKVATLLGLPYPGGPEIEALAQSGDPTRYPFKPGHVKGSPWSFSFSGLKTQVLYALKGQNGDKHALSLLPSSEKAHIAASFQETALGDIVQRVRKACGTYPFEAIYIGGGVSSSQRLRTLFNEAALPLPIYWPAKGLSVDNAAMIAGLGYWLAESGLDLEAHPNLDAVWK
jgi:N6-L-threonylcarbamoyladenine synthase